MFARVLRRWVVTRPANVPSLGMGVWFIFQDSRSGNLSGYMTNASVGVPYFSISISLNTPLTFLMVMQFLPHSRGVRNALKARGLYNAISVTRIGSSALSAVVSISFVGPWGAESWLADTFLQMLVQVQACGVFTFPACLKFVLRACIW